MPEGRIRLRGAPVDRATQRWVIRTGTKLALAEEEWLAGPVGAPEGIGESWIEQHAARVGARMVEEPDGGLLPRLDVLDGGGFRAGDLHPTVRDFYEHTARWQLDVWSRWARWAEPGGRLLNAVFARRLRQLGLPLDPLEVAYGMATRVVHLRSATGAHLGTAWQRSLRSTGATVFGGLYSITDVPRGTRPAIRVAFPLPNGNITVLLRPEVTAQGTLRLVSPRGPFGSHGAYLVVSPDPQRHAWSRRVPLPEQFDVFVDDRGELRCDHQLRLGSAEVLRLHYRMRSADVPATPSP